MSEIWIKHNGTWIYYRTVEQGSLESRCIINDLDSSYVEWRYQ